MNNNGHGYTGQKRKAYTMKVKLTAIIANTIYRKFITLVRQVGKVLIEAGSSILAGSIIQAGGFY